MMNEQLYDPYAGILNQPNENGAPANIRVATTASRKDVQTIKSVVPDHGILQYSLNLFIRHLANKVRKHDYSYENRIDLIKHIQQLCTADESSGVGCLPNERRPASGVRTPNTVNKKLPTNSVGKQTTKKG